MLLELDVNEISLVDKPANEEPFVHVIKRLLESSEEQMAKPETDVKEEGKVPAEEVKKEEEPKKEVAKEETKVEKESDDSKLAELTVALKALLEQNKKDADETPQEVPTIEIDGDVVIKGQKRFSRDRMKKIKELAQSVLGLVRDVDGDLYKELTGGGVATESAPAKKSVEAEKDDSTSIVAQVEKLFSGLEKKLGEKIDAKMEEVSKRVEKVESSNAVSKGLSQEDTEKPAQKSESNFWSGVLS